MKSNITNNKDFIYFKKRVGYWSKEFGLERWRLYFEHKLDDGRYAWCNPNFNAKIATIGLSKDWGTESVNIIEIDRTAKHEVLHLLVNPLYTYANNRFVTQQQIDDAEEEIIMLLEKKVR